MGNDTIANKNKKIVQDFFVQGYQKHDYGYIMEIVSDDYIDHSPAGARSNKDAVGILKAVETMFSDMKIEILDLFEEDGMVATRIKYSGVHTGVCMGIAPTNKHVTFEALENFKIQNGKITESWGYWPDLEIQNILEEN